MSRVFNKMYIVSGGVTGNDRLSAFRFQTKASLDKVPDFGFVTPLFDIAIEVDTTGKHIEYDTCPGDGYWFTDCESRLKDLNCHTVARINDKWQQLDIPPFADSVDDCLRKAGYERKLGDYGSGWYDKSHRPDFKTAVLEEIHLVLKLEWDTKRNRYAGIRPHMKEDELAIYSGDSVGCYDKKIGRIIVESGTVVVELDDKKYRFNKETDQDFTTFVNFCLDSNIAGNLARRPKSNRTPEAIEQARRIMTDMKQIEFEHISESFSKLFKEYAK